MSDGSGHRVSGNGASGNGASGNGGRPSRRPLVLAAVVAGGWLTVLAVLAAVSGNDPLVSRDQIERATLVVAADNAGDGVWVVTDTLKGSPPDPARITLLNGPDADSAVLPLSPAGAGRYEITPVPVEGKSGVARPIYPVRPAVEETVRSMTDGR